MHLNHATYIQKRERVIRLHTSMWIRSLSQWIHSALVSVMIIKMTCIWLLWLFALLLLSMNFSQCQSSEIITLFRQTFWMPEVRIATESTLFKGLTFSSLFPHFLGKSKSLFLLTLKVRRLYTDVIYQRLMDVFATLM